MKKNVSGHYVECFWFPDSLERWIPPIFVIGILPFFQDFRVNHCIEEVEQCVSNGIVRKKQSAHSADPAFLPQPKTNTQCVGSSIDFSPVRESLFKSHLHAGSALWKSSHRNPILRYRRIQRPHHPLSDEAAILRRLPVFVKVQAAEAEGPAAAIALEGPGDGMASPSIVTFKSGVFVLANLSV